MSGTFWDWHFHVGWWPDRPECCLLRIGTLNNAWTTASPSSPTTFPHSSPSTSPTTTGSTATGRLPIDLTETSKIFSSHRQYNRSVNLPACLPIDPWREIYTRYRAAKLSFCLLALLSRRNSLWGTYPLLTYTRQHTISKRVCRNCFILCSRDLFLISLRMFVEQCGAVRRIMSAQAKNGPSWGKNGPSWPPWSKTNSGTSNRLQFMLVRET